MAISQNGAWSQDYALHAPAFEQFWVLYNMHKYPTRIQLQMMKNIYIF